MNAASSTHAAAGGGKNSAEASDAATGPGKMPGAAKEAGSKAKTSGRDGVKPASPGVARITSSLLVYSDLKRQAEFTGGVRVLDEGGEMRGQQATVFLTPASPASAAKKDGGAVGAGEARGYVAGFAAGPGSSLAGLFGGSVERIVATQKIEITQPGRKATGERLVYTASDQMFVLTGSAGAPAKVVDQAQGTTTGAMLRFHSGDDSVVVLGTNGDVPAMKVRSETTVKSGSGGQTSSAGKTSTREKGTKSQRPGVKEK